MFAGTPSVAVPTLQALHASNHEVVAVVTRLDARTGRGRKVAESPVAVAAAALGLPVLKTSSANTPEFIDQLREFRPDIGAIVAFGALLRREVLDVPQWGWVNLHFSVLPAWRGAAPVQRAIMAGDEVTGATAFSLVEELDAGPVLGTLTEPIGADDTAGDLLDRLAARGSGLMVDVFDHIEAGDMGAVRQPEAGVSYAHKLTTEDARIDWTRPAFAVDRLIRGCTPAPGAWTTWASSRVKIGPATVTDESTLNPGEVRITKKTVEVGTGTQNLLLGVVQPPGKSAMNAADWARGLAADSKVEFE